MSPNVGNAGGGNEDGKRERETESKAQLSRERTAMKRTRAKMRLEARESQAEARQCGAGAPLRSLRALSELVSRPTYSTAHGDGCDIWPGAYQLDASNSRALDDEERRAVMK